jgi:hypothetical protein
MPQKKIPKEVSEFLRKAGLKGGSKGGKAAAANMTPEQRAERARKAAAKSAEVRRKKTQNPKVRAE